MNPQPWLVDVSWDMVAWQNQQLCESKRAHHGPTSDGHDACKKLWEDTQARSITLDELVDLCRQCHRHAPFTNYNGNTFAAIARAMIGKLDLPQETAAIGRSLAGHIVAGVASDVEVAAFRDFCKGINP